ncbi:MULTISPECIES: TetR family transcriptional regulator [Pseudomonas]|uniref:TetR family transcriptional regulator n=1 Tax=Pseudomonas aegrilactucae TaxID=2854028 RepID=A0A9Q2XIQ3_9PSED|nr:MULTISPECIES: TetR family transcriptional regulator [Pseudomonas]MBC3410217.1 TetR family transcriptional regulator [Pseudomonas sp. SWRI51]MBV6287065.1 TetR family transcriptional regulator [Pseudomonas aegrilactucae]MDD2075051.1 TetR family transcriptional regulator [Pseudomonas putida]WRW01623.1 TetR family transcriptional regulator [Pseudomonas putida]HDS1690663.1 TetR family transcriptional regulator [Pseudomonas putida]
MNNSRKPAEDREKLILLALARIRNNRSNNDETKVSISAVAREAGVSASLIHNHYPKVAEIIRTEQDKSSRTQRDLKHSELKSEKTKNTELRTENKELKLQIAKLASINEMLIIENRELRAIITSENVSHIPKT